MALKTYILEITYDDETEEIEDIYEEVEQDVRYFRIGKVDMKEYWDEETRGMLNKMYDIGEAWDITRLIDKIMLFTIH